MIDSLRRAIYHTLKAAWYWAFGEPGFVTITGEDGGKHRIDTRAIKFITEESPLPGPKAREIMAATIPDLLTPEEVKAIRQDFEQEYAADPHKFIELDE